MEIEKFAQLWLERKEELDQFLHKIIQDMTFVKKDHQEQIGYYVFDNAIIGYVYAPYEIKDNFCIMGECDLTFEREANEKKYQKLLAVIDD